eukprot:CAMPEP_0116116910 /NCGR_PEP_ID=MMETSP0329-20121206/1288_1 /TAXON_ID=697910 /ORGANISM="Pseudo-nitzschia arenysensis, Strain B593" /LENGTH=334 /DNA_ID=CAMNT_0003610433 /DNA_START=92 /DNA_END=1096 /DNA_ORIENTATION=-
MAANSIPLGRNIVALVRHFPKALILALLLVLDPFKNDSIALALSFGGFCTRCNVHHVLPTTDEAMQAALGLRNRIIQSGRIDIDELPIEEQERLLSSSSLNGKNGRNQLYIWIRCWQPRDSTNAEGKCLGCLFAKPPPTIRLSIQTNKTLILTAILKAYAGKLGGQWNLPGWAPLVGKVPESIPEFQQMSNEVTKLFERIDKLSSEKTNAENHESDSISDQIKELTKERSRISTLCIDELRKHQVLKNFRGIRMPIKETFAKGPTKLPGGTGDCAAPKLVAQAVKLGLKPTGICEIFIGATGGMSTTKGDGNFYDACEPRCQQIAGYMLCGLEI